MLEGLWVGPVTEISTSLPSSSLTKLNFPNELTARFILLTGPAHSVFHSFHGVDDELTKLASSQGMFIAQLVEHCSTNADAKV